MERELIYDEDFIGFVQQLISSKRIEGKEAGIAQSMIDKGYDSLSDKQRYVFDKIINENVVKECRRCGTDIPWVEMSEALNNGGFCGYCQHMMEKIEKE